MKTLNLITLALIIIGGINWGLVGFFDYNLVDQLFTQGSLLARTIYSIVGIAALWSIYSTSAMMSEKE